MHQILDTDLSRALDRLADEHIYLRGPDRDDGIQTKWLPCAHCQAVCVVPSNIVSYLCDECEAPCPYGDEPCGLAMWEHHHDADGPICEPVTEVSNG